MVFLAVLFEKEKRRKKTNAGSRRDAFLFKTSSERSHFINIHVVSGNLSDKNRAESQK